MIRAFILFSAALLLVSPILVACQTTAPSASTAQQEQTAGRLLLPTADGRQMILKSGKLQILKGNKTLADITVTENRFAFSPLSESGPYTYQGQGEIERIQTDAIPIGGSQGGFVPGNGSQGGFQPGNFQVLQLTTPQAGDQISFNGDILQDLSKVLPAFTLEVPATNISAQNAIVNVNSDVKNSTQVVIPGNTQGNITIINGNATHNRPPTIISIQQTPSGPIAPGTTVTLTAEAQDPDGDTLQYAWSAARGTLSADRGKQISWTAHDTKGDLPASLEIVLIVKDANGANDTLRLKLLLVKSEQG